MAVPKKKMSRSRTRRRKSEAMKTRPVRHDDLSDVRATQVAAPCLHEQGRLRKLQRPPRSSKYLISS